MPPDPLLEQLERTLADSYKREIEAEENVWRSLPFQNAIWHGFVLVATACHYGTIYASLPSLTGAA